MLTIKIVMLVKGVLTLLAIPLYLAWFYFIYYMIFVDFKAGAMLFGLVVVLGYVLSFINKALSSYLIRLIASSCDVEEEREDEARVL